MIKICEFCKSEYEPKTNLDIQRFCSKKCKNEFYYRNKRKIENRDTIIEKECLWCGEKFTTTYRFSHKKYCTKNCGRNHWRKLNPEKDKAQAERDREKLKSDPIRYAIHKEKVRLKNQTPIQKFRHYRKGAETRGYPFELTFEQFMTLWQKPCSYCGSEIKTIGIDRKINSKGYTVENSIPCCETCNKMKMKTDYKDFVDQCKKITNFISTIRA